MSFFHFRIGASTYSFKSLKIMMEVSVFMPTKVIAVYNKKVSIGKTVSVINFAVALVRESKKGVLLDIDAKANTTKI